MLLDEAHRRRPALLDLLLLLQVARGRQHHAAGVPPGMIERVLERERRAHVVVRAKAATHMTGPDADLEHDRRVRRLGQFETGLDRSHDALEIRLGIEQPDLRLHRKGVAALLHDRGAFAVVLANNDQRAAGHPARREVGERVGGDVGADRRFEGGGAAQRIIDRGAESGSGGRLVGARLEAYAELGEHIARVRHHVDEVRDRRALIARHVGDARLQQRLGDGQDAFAAEFLSRTQLELRHLALERPLRHDVPSSALIRPLLPLVPAKAGPRANCLYCFWIPACAGMSG